ncbi:MAG: hypothetical protein RLZ63_1274 [Pseudomonadota bacterium]
MPSSRSLPHGITALERDWLSANHVFLEHLDQTVLIDSGYCTHAPMTLHLLRQALQERSLTTLVNTHLHSDHCGGNASIQAEFTSVNTLTPPGHFDAVKNWDAELLTYAPTGQNCPRFVVNQQLQDRCEYEWGRTRWTAYAAPGHDNHAMMFFCAQHGILISGDALWEKGFGVIFPELDADSGYQQAANTLNLIEDLDAALVIPGHGSLFTDVQSALRYARQRLEAFQSFPDKHARYASKVLVKFKLQEYGTISMQAFLQWAQNVPYLITLHRQLGAQQPFSHWFEQLLAELCQSGVMEIRDQQLINTA